MTDDEVDEGSQGDFKEAVAHEVGASNTFNDAVLCCFIIHQDPAALLRDVLRRLLFKVLVVRRTF